MLINKKGDILKATENIICHQVNEDGVMGGGLARQIADAYPKVEKQYKTFCQVFKIKKDLIGQYVIANIRKHKYIANCFTQDNFVTNLLAIERVFRGLLESCKSSNLSICIPKNYGCGIAKGNWEDISKLLEDLSNEYEIDIAVYELEDSE